MFWRVDLASCWRLTSVAKNACLAKSGVVFKIFFSFSLELFVTVHFLSQLFLSKHSVSFSSNSIVALVHLQIFKEKVWALILSPHISYFDLHFLEYLCWCFLFLLWVCFGVFGFVLVWIT